MPAASQTQSYLRYPLTGLLGSAGNVRVLRALVADRALQSAPQLAAMAGLTPQGARGVLDALARQRLAKVHGSGRTQLYELNASHPLSASLTALFQQEQTRWEGLLTSIRELLEHHGVAISAAWLYGSVARGEDSPASDVDVALLVRSAAVAEQVREALMPLEDEQQIRISLTALTAKELAALPEDDPWWMNVVRDSRVLKGAAPAQVRRRLLKVAA
ncbi:nucleotidyltransferase domain-containing protein [Paucibacter sp. PLA-PC-4]|uniref:nucleotidyltransferase domain-containing protein n=1 Tax=Paucibacter sp. PLA-PC-4 TaxID=2993655 RepID=UPI0022490EEC|nr:nucleotidyltransferase domain-containing protein [Paucibacter sp. PLA-PC-4]MCX2862755.1 nucleotidyltransferase domain-containing protein [Paucibacter sp. PLA-PC-4]